jgi:hypothetical protein
MVLAFLASQHHNVHMVLLAVGLGGSGMAFMRAYPGIRRGMLIVSLGVVVVNLNSLRRGRVSAAMRVIVMGFSLLTVALLAWSVVRFGL